MNGLPTELLVHILYVGTYSVDDPDTPLPFPVIASHVCHLWRSVAVGLPSLWTTITFSKLPLYERCKVWIERSKSLPIEIKFEVARLDEDTAYSHVSTILDIIVPHVTRWQKLDVFVYQDVRMKDVLTRLAQCASAPLLESLALHHFDAERPNTTSSLVPFHGNTPRLSYLTLDNVIIGLSSSLLHNVVGFKLVLWPSPAEPFTDWQDEQIELPSLQNFSLTNHDPIYVSSLFRLLSMPNLKKLSLDLYDGDFSEFVRQLATPLRSALSTLQYLKIEDLSCDASIIYAMCEQLTNLKSIYLDKSIYKPFVTTLMESFSGALYCPNLTTIIISGISGQEMRSFIAVRATAGIPIKRMAMSKDGALNDEDERWLRENVPSFERFDNDDDTWTWSIDGPGKQI